MSSNVETWSPTSNAGITLTPAAIAHLKKELLKQSGIALHFGLKKSGCSGYAYAIDIIKQIDASDHVFTVSDTEQGEIKIVVSPKNLPYLTGTTIDFVREGLNSRLKFINPNEKGSCGCGESISV